MKYLLVIIAIICLLSTIYAAQLTIAGYDITTENVVVSANDVLAPITTTSAHILGCALKEQNNTVTITNNYTTETLAFTLNSTNAVINGKTTAISVAPVKKSGELLLPLKVLANFLKIEFIQDTKNSVYKLLPSVSVSYASVNAKDVVTITSALPIEYKYGVLTDHHRVYVDVSGTHIPKSTTTQIKGFSMYALRTNQMSSAPPTTRIVADLRESCEPSFVFSNNDRKLTITLSPKVKTVIKSMTLDADDKTEAVTLKVEANKAVTPNVTTDKNKVLVALPVILTATEQANFKKISVKYVKKIDVLENNTLELTMDDNVISTVLSSDSGMPYLLKIEKIDPNAATTTVVSSKPMPTKIKDAVVVIDAGHGGSDSGAVGQNKVYEKTVNLDVALRVEKLLKAKGVTVLMTRTTDKALVLADRPKLGNNSGADLFVSIHCNSCATPNTANGTETYYCTDMSIEFARVMQKNVVDSLGRVDRKHKFGNFLVIRESKMPSVLVEMAYINHSVEESLLNSPDFRQKAAVGISNGVIAYLKACGATE